MGQWMSELVNAKHLEIGYPLESDGKRIDSEGTKDYDFPDTHEGDFIFMNTESLVQGTEIARTSPIITNG